MGLSKEQVLETLKQHGVQFQAFEHPPVMTCEAQAEALKGVQGAVTKNLFLRDKKRRQYVITALHDTKVDLKVLSVRLGCGKGGLSWGSEELLAQSLQVEPGCVTPLALANADTCKHVQLLIDAKLRGAGSFFVHPIVNSCSVLLDAPGLDAFLQGIGRSPIYVDLEAEPKIDAANPPDLKPHADAIEPPPKEDEPAAASSSAASSASNLAAAGTAAAAAGAATGAAGAKAAKAAKKGGGGGGSKADAPAQQSEAARHIALTNVVTRTDELVELVSRALTGKSAADVLGADSYALRRLRADVQMQLTAFKNAAYTAGYKAGKDEVVAFATNRYR